MAGMTDRLLDGVVARVADRVFDALDPDLVKGKASGQALVPSGKVPPEPPKGEEMQALMWDPFALLETLGYRERYSMVSYYTLLNLAYRVPIFPGILQTRLNQVGAFAEAQQDKNQAGFRITTRQRDKTVNKKLRVRCQDMEDWISNTGSTKSLKRDGFDAFLRKYARDSLIFDQGAFEIVENRKGVPADFYAVDGSSIRIADTPWNGNEEKSDDEVCYVQVHDNNVVAEFTPKQLCLGIRNPRSDLRVNGYGMSELEMGVHIITSLLFGFQYNSRYFSQGSVAKGMLNLPDVTDGKLRIFARQWHMVASGVLNAWRTPITNFRDAQWINFQQSNRDMEFGDWLNYLTKLFTSIMGIDPSEINQVFGNQGQSSQMFASPEETRIKESKDRGLRPLLKHISSNINRYLIWRIDPELRFEFTGLDPRAAEKMVAIGKQEVGYIKKINEIRAERDLDPLKGEEEELGELILDPQYIQAWQTIRQERQEAEQQEGMGEEGEEGAPGGEEGGMGEDDWGSLMGEAGGGEEGEEGQEGAAAPDMGEEDWEGMMNEASAKKSLTKATVLETEHAGTVTYEIDLEE